MKLGEFAGKRFPFGTTFKYSDVAQNLASSVKVLVSGPKEPATVTIDEIIPEADGRKELSFHGWVQPYHSPDRFEFSGKGDAWAQLDALRGPAWDRFRPDPANPLNPVDIRRYPMIRDSFARIEANNA